MKVGFHISGFGKFEGCSVNPTEKLVCQLLPNSLKASPLLPNNNNNNNGDIVILSLTVFETSVDGTLSAFNKLWKSYQLGQQPPLGNNNNNNNQIDAHSFNATNLIHTPNNGDTPVKVDRVVWLHFGVHGGATKILLEDTAYNEADFSCPDEQGFVATGCAIDRSMDIKSTLSTLLPVKSIAEKLASPPFSFQVTTSHDPGRFLCNYAYYQSLNFSRKLEHHYSLFVHIPPFSKFPEEVQLEFMRKLIQELYEALAQ